MGFFFSQTLQNKNVALATSEITQETVFWVDNVNMQKGGVELLFLPSALSEVSTVKSDVYTTHSALYQRIY